MGACCSCCADENATSTRQYAVFGAPVDTEKDREARSLAAEKAAARQSKFEATSAGRAAYRDIKEIKSSKTNPTNAAAGGVTAADWQS